MLRDKIIAAARTGFAVLGSAIVTWVVLKLADLGVVVKVDETWSTLLAGAMFAIFVGLYNVAVQWLTEHVWSGFGWLLGNLPSPTYVDVDLRTEDAGDDGGAAVDKDVVEQADRHFPYDPHD